MTKESYFFCGIAGCGMNPLAHLLALEGHTVYGSDLQESPELEALRKDGVICHAGQNGKDVEKAEVFVRSSAIREENEDYQKALTLGKKILHRSELLAKLFEKRFGIAIAGSHGKTTATSLTSYLLANGGLDPGAVVGGFVPAFNGNFRAGLGPLVIEADESDGTFRRYSSSVAVILNIDRDHLDFYRDLEEIKAAFEVFVGKIKKDGVLVYCADDPNSVEAAATARPDVKKISYGLSKEFDYSAQKINLLPGKISCEVIEKESGKICTVECNLPGRHNVYNILAASAAARAAGLPFEKLSQAFLGFKNACRRFENLGNWRGATVIDDYAHHPEEIAALLKSAAAYPGEATMLFQPHRFSRTEKLLPEFAQVLKDAPNLILTEVYSAGEDKGALSGYDLYEAVKKAGGNPEYVSSPAEIPALLEARSANWKFPHTLYFTGAGALSHLAHEMLKNKDK